MVVMRQGAIFSNYFFLTQHVFKASLQQHSPSPKPLDQAAEISF